MRKENLKSGVLRIILEVDLEKLNQARAAIKPLKDAVFDDFIQEEVGEAFYRRRKREAEEFSRKQARQYERMRIRLEELGIDI